MLKPNDFFDFSNFVHKEIFAGSDFVWEALGKLKQYIGDTLRPNLFSGAGKGLLTIPETCVLYDDSIIYEDFDFHLGDALKGELKIYYKGEELKGASLICKGSAFAGSRIYIGRGSIVEPGAMIKEPTIIGDNCEIRQGAYIRGGCIIGNKCVAGHTTEMKNAIMLDDAKAGHFAYIGDSILGNNVNLGAGTKIANLTFMKQEITLRIKGAVYKTGMRKFGAILGDNVNTGCNSVTSPGTLAGRDSVIFPCINVKGGFYEKRSIIRE